MTSGAPGGQRRLRLTLPSAHHREPTGWTARGTGVVTGFFIWVGSVAWAFLSRPGLYNNPGAYSPEHKPLLWAFPFIGSVLAGFVDYALFGITRDALKVAQYTLTYPLWLLYMTMLHRAQLIEWQTFRRRT